MKRRNYYKEAIDIVSKEECHYRKLLIEIAKNKPSALCHAYDLLKHRNFESVIKYLKQGEKINAIKEYRSITGAGLKEAKEAVEDMSVKPENIV